MVDVKSGVIVVILHVIFCDFWWTEMNQIQIKNSRKLLISLIGLHNMIKKPLKCKYTDHNWSVKTFDHKTTKLKKWRL